MAQIGVKIPAVITDRLHVIESDNDQKTEKTIKRLVNQSLFLNPKQNRRDFS
ncbi:hypothetical protein QNN00_22770 [Bacillus velezensis]|nr:hypothetical protein [Bacillus velezensis]